jgi:L-histidine N-alpha-methyltransferase
MNRELGADVDLDQIEHVARYNADWQRIEIFTRFLVPQTIHNRPVGRRHRLRKDEKVMIEISRKFVLDDLREFVRYFGFEVRRAFTDENRWFGVLLLQKGDDL